MQISIHKNMNLCWIDHRGRLRSLSILETSHFPNCRNFASFIFRSFSFTSAPSKNLHFSRNSHPGFIPLTVLFYEYS